MKTLMSQPKYTKRTITASSITKTITLKNMLEEDGLVYKTRNLLLCTNRKNL